MGQVENLLFLNSPYWTFWVHGVDGLEVRFSEISARRTDIDYHDLVDMTAFNTDGFDVTGALPPPRPAVPVLMSVRASHCVYVCLCVWRACDVLVPFPLSRYRTQCVDPRLRDMEPGRHHRRQGRFAEHAFRADYCKRSGPYDRVHWLFHSAKHYLPRLLHAQHIQGTVCYATPRRCVCMP